ncbi:MAG: hypothetical protein KBE65_23100 [Phycisphaerae bacterium]|nr:hypothetical protein [Phycisphaerae bacterium]
MFEEWIAQHPHLWTLAWQSTTCLTAGLGGSYLLRRRAVRAHQVLLLALVAAIFIPAISQVVKQKQWGLFVAERAVPKTKPDAPGAQTTPAIARPRTTQDAASLPAPVENTAVAPTPVAERFDWVGAVVPAWLLVSGVLFLRLASQFLLGRRVTRQSKVVDEPRIAGIIDAAKDKLKIETDVVVRTGSHIPSPAVWCWGRQPTLLIPQDSCDDGGSLDWTSIVCHELAHWRRRDHVSGLLAELVVCAAPWQPLAWWARRRLVALSEEACDDWVIASGQTATSYAKTLLGLVPQGQTGLVPSVVPSRSGLAGRIRRILHDACGNPRAGLRWSLVAAVLTTCLGLGIAFAQTRPATQSAQARSTQPQVQVAAASEEQPSVSNEKIALRLVDPEGKPVAGARAGAYMQVRNASVLGSKLDWRSAGDSVSDPGGQIVLNAKDVFQSQREKETLYILHESRGIGAVCEIARGSSDDKLPVVVLKPVCRVQGKLASAGLATIGMPLRWAHMYVYLEECQRVLECDFEEARPSFEFLLPPGAYTFNPYGSGGKGEDPPRVGADTEFKMLPVTISEGQQDLDLGVIDLVPTKLATLIGRPAPEIGPMKAWKNGAPVTLGQLKGQVVWLHFGGRYPITSRDLPELAELHETFGDKGLTIIAIFNCASTEELEQTWADVNQQSGGVREVPFRVAIDGGEPTFYRGTNHQRAGATYGRYDIIGSPTNVLIDRAGNMVGQPNPFYAQETVSQMLGVRPESLEPDWRQRFNAVYRLADNEILKRIAPPFIPERIEYWKNDRKLQAEGIPWEPDHFTFDWNGKLRIRAIGFQTSADLGSVLSTVLRLRKYEYEGSESLLRIELPGDWVIRDKESQETRLRGLEQLLAREVGRKIRFERRSVPREAIIATGKFRFHPPVDTYDHSSVHLYAGQMDPNQGLPCETADSLGKFLLTLSECANMPVIDQTEQQEKIRLPYRQHCSCNVGEIQDEQERARQLKVVLDHLTEQTELQFEVRTQPVPVWFIVEGTDH